MDILPFEGGPLQLYFLFIFWLDLFLLNYNKSDKKNQRLIAYDIVESKSKEMLLLSYITCVGMFAFEFK